MPRSSVGCWNFSTGEKLGANIEYAPHSPSPESGCLSWDMCVLTPVSHLGNYSQDSSFPGISGHHGNKAGSSSRTKTSGKRMQMLGVENQTAFTCPGKIPELKEKLFISPQSVCSIDLKLCFTRSTYFLILPYF